MSTEARIERAYARLLQGVVARPVVAVGFAVLLAAFTAASFSRVGTGFFPAADEGGFVLDYLTPAGSALGETDRQVRAIEKVISDIPEVASYSRRTGSELGLFATAQNTGDILVRLKPRSEPATACVRPRCSSTWFSAYASRNFAWRSAASGYFLRNTRQR